MLVAVGQDEQPLPPVRRSSLGRAEQTPLRMEPEGGKVSEHGSESQPKVACDILKAYDGRLALLDDSPDVRPEVARVLLPLPLAGDGERLARVARRDEIHDSTPRSAVERGQVVPDRSWIQGRFANPGHEDGRSVGVPLDVTHSSQPGPGAV